MPHDHDHHHRYLFLERRFVDEAFACREADAVWSVQFRGRPVYIFLLMEFQSTVDPGMPADEVVAVTELPQVEVERLAAEAPSDEADRDDRSQ
jgi:predicted transposase YdaD